MSGAVYAPRAMVTQETLLEPSQAIIENFHFECGAGSVIAYADTIVQLTSYSSGTSGKLNNPPQNILPGNYYFMARGLNENIHTIALCNIFFETSPSNANWQISKRLGDGGKKFHLFGVTCFV